MSFRILLVFLLATAIGMARGASTQSRTDPFAFLQPTIRLSDDDRRRLDERAVVLMILPAGGHELAILTAGSLAIGPDAFAASVHNVAALKRSSFVPQIGRFSSQPRLEDLQELTLDGGDVDEIRRCQPQRCGLKLEGEEIRRLQQAISTAPKGANAPVDAEFRRVVLDRATRYLRNGDGSTDRQFSSLVQHSPYVHARMPQIAAYLEKYPAIPLAGAESFLYWSKETYAWKPMITVTHVTMLRGNGQGGAPEVLAVSRDVFATRYTSGSFVLTMLFPDPDNPAQRYLVYINRTWVDMLAALWRPFVEHRVKSQARKLFAATRDRIEQSGGALASQNR